MYKTNFYCLMRFSVYTVKGGNFWRLNWGTVAEALLIPGFPTVVAGGKATYPQLHNTLGKPQGIRDHVICQFVSDGSWKEERIFVHYLLFFCSSMSVAIQLWRTLRNFAIVSRRSSLVFH